MYSSIDAKEGIVQTYWKDIRERFIKADPHLAKLIDNVSPDNLPIYLLYFPYGMLKGDTNSSYIPLFDGNLIKLSDENVDREIVKDLGYGMHSSPLGIILDKYIEYFIEFDNQVFPYHIAGPGTIFNTGILLREKGTRNYAPNGILKATAGSRTAFMLPSINSHNGINKLSKLINSSLSTPRNHTDHFELFKVINQKYNNGAWKACLAYFSETWIKHLLSDPAWIEIKNYILEGKKTGDSFNANSAYYEIFYAKAQKDRNLRTSSPYLTNTAIHLIKVALGEYPGYVPATTSNLLPIDSIQKCIADSFQLKRTATIMVPHLFVYEKEDHPIYYSLQNLTTPHFLMKKNEKVTANQEIEVVHGILSGFIEEMAKPDCILAGTVFSQISKVIQFNYFHNYPPKDSNLIQNSRLLSGLDPRFNFSTLGNNESDFCFEGQFLRGCVQIQVK